MSRQRQVFPTSEIPHKWAHQTQPSARNPQGNLFFRGPTIYSYRESWPLARIYTRKDDAKLVLANSASYSVTTGTHQNHVNRAAQHMTRISVPHVTDWRGTLSAEQHAANIAYLQKTAAEHLAKAQRALRVYAVEWRRKAAFDRLTECGQYMGFFRIRRKAPVIPVAEWHAAEQRVARIENPDPASADKRQRAAAKRKTAAATRLRAKYDALRAQIEIHNAAALAERNVSAEEAVAHWREHGNFPRVSNHDTPYVPWSEDRKFRAAGLHLPRIERSEKFQPEHVLLRVNGDQIETSMGARVPLAAAPMVWTYVQGHLKSRHAANGHAREFAGGLGRVRIGDYPLDRIDADGTLHAGCHVIPYSELSALARQLGLAS